MGQLLKVRITTDRLRQKIAKAKALLPQAAEQSLEKLASEAVRLIQQAPDGSRRAFVRKHLGRQFASIFVPVTLTHQRKERWPNLRPIYQARIVRGQSTFEGRRLFYVDREKDQALFETLAAEALTHRKGEVYDVRFMRAAGNRFRIEIVKRGGGRIPPVVIAFARQKLRAAGAHALRIALHNASLRP